MFNNKAIWKNMLTAIDPATIESMRAHWREHAERELIAAKKGE